MTGGCHCLDPEPPHIPCQSMQYVEIQFTGSAASGGNLPDLERSAAHFFDPFLQLFFRCIGRVICNQALPGERAQTVFIGEADRFGEFLCTFAAENTFAAIQHCVIVLPAQKRTGGTLLIKFFRRRALSLHQNRSSLKMRRKIGFCRRKGPGTVSLKKSCTESLKHGNILLFTGHVRNRTD